MRALRIFTVAALLGLMPSNAQALDLWPADDGALGPIRWSGFIINPDVGFEEAELKGTGGDRLQTVQGWRAGAELGYDHQMGSIVVGIAVDAFKTWMDGDESTDPALLAVTADLDYFGTVRGRLGYAMGRWLVYGTGGYAFGKLTIDDTIAQTSDSASLGGWAAGGGVEWVYNDSLTVRGEYVHIDLAEDRFTNLPVGLDQVGAEIDRIGIGFVTRY